MQGATVTTGLTVAAGTTATASVAGTGALYGGGFVRVGPDGPILSVVSTTSPSLVSLQNNSGVSVTIPVTTRLVLLTARPTAYQDALATVALGTAVTCDSGGRAQVFLPEGEYDYMVTDPADPAVVADAATIGTLAAATNTFQWAHTIVTGQTMLLVAISWQESTASESLTSVTYNGVAMTPAGVSLFVQLFILPSPPTGTHNVVVTFSGSNNKAAVGGAIGLSNLNATTPLTVPRQLIGPGTTGGTSAAGSIPKSWVFAALAVNTLPGTTTVTPGSGTTSLWNQSIGTTGASDRTQAAGSSVPGSGDLVGITWGISPSRAWGAISVEALPAWYSLVTDVATVGSCNPKFGILANSFTSLQAAIDSLPNSGGVVYLSSGTYRQALGLIIDRPNVTLVGEGSNTIITPFDPIHDPVDLLTISASQTRLVDLKFDGGATTQDLTGGTCCIVMNGLGISGRLVQHCFFENVVVTGAARFGVWMRGVIIFTAINCEFIENLGTGVRIQGTATEDGATTTLRFYDSVFSSNGTIGVDVGDDEEDAPGVVGVTFMACGFENNAGLGLSSATTVGLAINANESAKIEALSCYFEGPAVNGSQFARFHNCQAATVDNCWFDGHIESGTQPDRAAQFLNCANARFSSNAASHIAVAVVDFDSGCENAVEFANRDLYAEAQLPAIPPRIVIEGRRFVGMSRWALGIPSHFDESALPLSASTPQKGSLLWVDSPDPGNLNLRVWDGSGWKNIAFS